MRYERLGHTDLVVSKLGFGTGSLGEMFGPLNEADAIAVVHEAVDLGVTFFDTAAYYGSAEERLGKALVGRRDQFIVGTKAGRFGYTDFDFSPTRIRRSLENSLRLLKTDYVDILQLHDIEYVPLGPVLEDSYAELAALRDEGLCRYIGMSGYPAAVMKAAMTQTDLDVCLTYAHATLLDDTLQREVAPVADARGIGLINAAAVALGLLTPGGTNMENSHPATAPIRAAAARMVALCAERQVDISFVANQYSIQRSGCATTLIGTGKSRHLRSAVAAVETPLDDELIAELLALRPPAAERTWPSGLPENIALGDRLSKGSPAARSRTIAGKDAT
jgi:aryl-alcohol dehydrogenase-like predicted oxidoreductase